MLNALNNQNHFAHQLKSSIAATAVFLRLDNAGALTWAFIASITLHATLLSLHFDVPARVDRLFQNNNLPMILVNVRLKANTNTRALAISQTNLTGGGEDNSGRMRSPLPSAYRTVEAQDTEDLERQESALKSLESEQSKLLAQVRSQIASLTPTQAHPLSADQESKRQRLLQRLAEIESRIEQSNKRPHIRYFSPSTRESEFAIYYAHMRQKIESFGTQHFPTYLGRKIYGSLTMIVNVNAVGQVLSVQLIESSGQPELDRRAQAIVLSSGPFNAFPPSLHAKADQLALISKFSFTENGTLETPQQ